MVDVLLRIVFKQSKAYVEPHRLVPKLFLQVIVSAKLNSLCNNAEKIQKFSIPSSLLFHHQKLQVLHWKVPTFQNLPVLQVYDESYLPIPDEMVKFKFDQMVSSLMIAFEYWKRRIEEWSATGRLQSLNIKAMKLDGIWDEKHHSATFRRQLVFLLSGSVISKFKEIGSKTTQRI